MTEQRKSANAVKGKPEEKGDSAAAAASRNELDYGDLPSLLGYHLRRAQLRVFQHFGSAMGSTNMTPGRFGLLVLIERNPGISQTALARAVGIERSTLGEVIDRFVQGGLIEREVSASDRRSNALRLTGRGRDVLADLRPRIARHEKEVARALSEVERARLLDLLRRLADG